MAILSMVTQVLQALKEVTSYKLFNDVATDETTSDAIEVLDAEAITVVVETSAGVSGGVVLLEGAMTSDYAGTWIFLGSITTSAASKSYDASISLGSGDPLVRYARLRVETAISGGTVDAYLNVRK